MCRSRKVPDDDIPLASSLLLVVGSAIATLSLASAKAPIAQASAHSFGLDHTFDCSDPMTYLPACGQQFFRNKEMDCGEYTPRSCRCGDNAEDPHVRLLAIFGQGITPPAPVVTLGFPADGATVANDFSVIVTSATD